MWSYATGGPITGTPAVRGGVTYVGSDDKKLHAIATLDGKSKWTYETLGAVATPVIASDGIVYVGSADGKLYAITTTGLLYFAVNVKGRIKGAPAINDEGAIYVTSDTGIHAIGP
jgi:outer membrane protein assembly factor BamB